MRPVEASEPEKRKLVMTMNKLDTLLTSLGLATISESMDWAKTN